MNTNLVYITTRTVEEARAIGKTLVSERLAAGANIIDRINSIYWWDGKIQDENEAILIAKTREPLVPKVIERVKSLHSYICPCIVSVPVLDGNPLFLDWIADETRENG